MKDITQFSLPNAKMNDKIVRHFHKKVVRFDYQAHDILYQRGLLQSGQDHPEQLEHFVKKI